MKLITNHSMKTDDDILMKNKVTKLTQIKQIVLLFFKNQCQVYLHHVRVVPVFELLEYLMSKFSISTVFLYKTFVCQLQMSNKVNQQLKKERKEKEFLSAHSLVLQSHLHSYNFFLSK